jgi:dimethylamine--corrinoid protein Co-methyltransferase
MFGMDVAHSCASGMNGLRAAGDLVARLQMAKGMRITEAKRYVADKLGATPRDLSDNQAMHERRGELRLGAATRQGMRAASQARASPKPVGPAS